MTSMHVTDYRKLVTKGKFQLRPVKELKAPKPPKETKASPAPKAARPVKQAAKVYRKVSRGSKFNNTIIETEDGKFDSKREYEEWKRLKLLASRGAIKDLRRQVKFSIDINGHHVCNYYADFCYTFMGESLVVDSKGHRTDVYKLKKKLLKAVHGITIKEV